MEESSAAGKESWMLFSMVAAAGPTELGTGLLWHACAVLASRVIS